MCFFLIFRVPKKQRPPIVSPRIFQDWVINDYKETFHFITVSRLFLETNTLIGQKKNRKSTFDDGKYLMIVDDIDMYSLLWIMM